MDKKWSIIDRKDVKEKCFQLEAAVRNVFEAPGSWVNGFIRLVSLEGTWYHHRATDIFIPMTQNYIDKSYRADVRPEKASIRLKSGAIFWDYMDEGEALQIFPVLPSSNMPKAVGTAGLAERCRNKRIFLADGRVYESEGKKVRPLQNGEEGTILQVYRLDDMSQRKNEAAWYYDIYLWAKLGVVPSALYSSKDSWNTMQFLINNFNNIDFGDFLALQGDDANAGKKEEQPSSSAKPSVFAKSSASAGSAVPPRLSMYGKSGSAVRPATPPRPVVSEKPAVQEAEAGQKTEAAEIDKAVERAETAKKIEAAAKIETAETTKEAAKSESAEAKIAETAKEAAKSESVEAKIAETAEEAVKSESVETKIAETAEEAAKSESVEAKIVETAEAAVKPEMAETTKVAEKIADEAPVFSELGGKIESREKSAEETAVDGMPEEKTEAEIPKENPEAMEEEQLKDSADEEAAKEKSGEEKEELSQESLTAKEQLQKEPVAEKEEPAKETIPEAEENPVPAEKERPEETVALAEILEANPEASEELSREPADEAEAAGEIAEVIEQENATEQEPEVLVKTAREEQRKAEEKEQPVESAVEAEIPEVSKEKQFKEPADESVVPEEQPVKIEIALSDPEVAEDSAAEAAWTKEQSVDKTATVEEAESAVAGESCEGALPSVEPAVSEDQERGQAEQLSKAEDTVVQRDIIQQEEEMVVSEDKIQELLDCDKNRCRLEPYDKDILYDIIRGHWELFEEQAKEKTGAGEGTAKTRKGPAAVKIACQDLIARDPKLDIRQGVVGIDFGTKSTVVVRQDATNRIVPIRIGTGNLSDDVKEEDFENPSIIEFTNVQKFLEEYQREAGRPHTSCNDVFVSYDAYEDFRNCKPDDFYAYFSELKQWANHEKGTVVVKDKQRREYYLGESMEIEEGTVNPVELYAYYIGLYINNMRNGIYLKYLMTFPVGYSKETRDFIANSFYNGIKKSLPSSILDDKECMDQFKVELGISEPAAYAITALEQNHLEPADETERLMYGIFDFGGGTTDFDFGICRGATEEEYERDAYDYVLECFGADSDVTLGGENILELMAYHVYQQNLDVFREKKITFTLPAGENSFAGSETLLINSQIARRNMAILKEELRPLWHQEQGWRKKYQLDSEAQNDVDKEGIVVSLYNMNGEPVPQCMLEFSSQDLVELIKSRIQKGIDSFFQCLIKIFLYKGQNKKNEENSIYIFLAGNSSKSVFVKELFQKKIEEYYGKSKKLSEEMGNAHFELIDPLTGKGDVTGAYIPNAKTGVAYGLLKSRAGSSVKIEKNYETDAMQQSRFHYYLGRDRRHHFDCKFSPMEVGYKKWVRFQGASREIVRIYYTNNPTADSKLEQMPIENVPYKEINIDVKEDAYLFIRTVEPDMVEYVVAKEVEEISDSDIKKCYFN